MFIVFLYEPRNDSYFNLKKFFFNLKLHKIHIFYFHKVRYLERNLMQLYHTPQFKPTISSNKGTCSPSNFVRNIYITIVYLLYYCQTIES